MSSRRAHTRQIDPAAVAALRSADPVLSDVIGRVGDFRPSHEPDLWWALVDAIASQQLSVKAASTILGRVRALGADGAAPGPAELLALADEELRACGLSRAKAAYVKDLARRFESGALRPERIASLEDEAVIAELTAVKGVGRWTAEMVLIFSLGRPDVLPVDDLGLRSAVQRAFGLAERPTPAEVLRMGDRWRPYRSLATLYLWRSLAAA